MSNPTVPPETEAAAISYLVALLAADSTDEVMSVWGDNPEARQGALDYVRSLDPSTVRSAFTELEHLRERVAVMGKSLETARGELFEAEDKFWVAHCNFPVTTKPSLARERQQQDKDFLAQMSDRMKAARMEIDQLLTPPKTLSAFERDPIMRAIDIG